MLKLLDRPGNEAEDLAAKELTKKLGAHALAISQMAALIISQGFSISSFNEIYDRNKKKLHRAHRSTRPSGYNRFLDTVWELSFQFLTMTARALLGIIAAIASDLISSRPFVYGKKWVLPADFEFRKDELRYV